jgi:hypothetical protein
MRRNNPNADAWSPVTRRQAIAGLGTLATAGAGVALFPSGGARAAVTVDELSLSDRTFTAASVRPVVEVSASYDYDVGNEVVSGLRFTVAVDGTQVDTAALSTNRATFSGTETLRGVVTDSEAWSADDFAPDVASSVNHDVAVRVTFAVLDDSGEAITSAEASDTATVEVRHPQESRYVAEVGGSGVFTTPDSDGE